MNIEELKRVFLDLNTALATISGYHPESCSTQIMVTTAINKGVEIKEYINQLESDKKDLEERVDDTENALTGAIDCINNLKCCGNCGTTSKYIVCQNCIRYDGFTNDGDLVDKWSKEKV